jgi:hypothetical protein
MAETLHGCDCTQSGTGLLTFQRNVLPPSSGLKNNDSSHCLVQSLALKMEALHSSVTLADFHWTTWRHKAHIVTAVIIKINSVALLHERTIPAE